MENLFVKEPTAILLKEKGFNEPCLAVYRGGSIYFEKSICGYPDQIAFSDNTGCDLYDLNRVKPNYWIAAPTYEQALCWIRENHNIHIGLYLNAGKDGYCVSIERTDFKEDKPLIIAQSYDYNEALEAGIKLVLKNI